ncbi:MAG: hypothetical protein V3V03_05575 [Hyphomonadaceae bacterium]
MALDTSTTVEPFGIRGRLKRALSIRLTLLCALISVAIIYGALLLHGAEGPILTFFFAAILLALAAIGRFAAPITSSQTPILVLVVAAVWLWYIFSGPAAQEFAATELATFLAAAGVWQLAVLSGADRDWRERTSLALLVCGLLYAIWAFAAHIGNYQHVSLSGASGAENPALHLTASLGSPDTAALVFGLLLVLATSRILQVWKRHYRAESSRWSALASIMRYGLLALVLLVFSLTCLLMTGSRSGFLIGLSGVAGLALSEWLLWPGRTLTQSQSIILKRLIPLGAVIVAGGIWTSKLLMPAPIETITGLSPLTGWGAAGSSFQLQIGLWMEAPLFGHGAGSLAAVEALAVTDATAATIYSPHSLDNFFMRGLIEYGIIGVGLVLVLLGGIMSALLNDLSTERRSRSSALLGLAGIWVWITHGMMDNSVSAAAVLWLATLIIGLAYGQARQDTNTDRVDETAGTE